MSESDHDATDGTSSDTSDEASDDAETADAEDASGEHPRTEPAPRTVREERKLSPMRRTIAERLSESYREAVHVTVSREMDAEALVDATDRAEEETGSDVSISFLDVLLCAVSAALSEHPGFNATFEEGTHRIYEEHNVAVAVAVDDGLLTPVIADVGARSLPDLAADRRRLTELVQAGDHAMADLRGSTFTVSNLGPLGVDSFTPIINPPEVAILGVNRLRDRARPGDEGVEFRRQLTVDCSFDHRVVDGADAARFLGTLAGHVEDADALVDGRLEG